MTEIRIPQTMWDDDSEGAMSVWFYDDGESVDEGTVIAEVMNEKMAFELAAPTSGKLVILVQAEQPVAKGQLVGRIDP